MRERETAKERESFFPVEYMFELKGERERERDGNSECVCWKCIRPIKT